MKIDSFSQSCLQRLRETLDQEEDEIDLPLSALHVASRFYPGLAVGHYVAYIDQMADRAKKRLGRARTPARVLAAINHVLYVEEGFHGNVEDYYDPRNSFLNEVLDRKTGIPITLSVLYLAIAQRLGQPVAGVGLPLHFIVKYVGPSSDIYVDPFDGGRVLTREDCRERVEKAYGAPVTFQDSYLNAVPARLVLYRMLNNLKYIYIRHQDFARAGQVVEQMLVVHPEQSEEVRDLGLLHFQERDWGQAIEYLTRYLEETPSPSDTDSVRQRLQEALDHRARRN
jgi:regulator of sirC expression with transglutaminase-like and TPR domain